MGNEDLILIVEQHSKDIRELQRQYNELSNGQVRVETKLESISDTLKELKLNISKEFETLQIKVNELAEKPGKRWDALVNAGIAAVVSAMMGILIYLKN